MRLKVNVMNAEIIAVGTELLMGQIVNTNSSYLAKELAQLHIPVYFQQVVGDNENRMQEAFLLASQRSQLVFITGGLGPTPDDITKQTLAKFLQEDLIEDKEAMDEIRKYHTIHQKEMTENNCLQALTFKNGRTLPNHNGLAVGGIIEKQDTTFIVLPGPPRELDKMFQLEVKPYLWKKIADEQIFQSTYLRFFGLGESKLTHEIRDILEKQTNPTIGTYAGNYEVVLRLTANAKTSQECETLLENCGNSILERLEPYFYGYGEHHSLMKEMVQACLNKKLTLSVAESLTAGLFQAKLAEISGVSSLFKGGWVVYSKEMKQKQLQISRSLLDTYGTVSKECAIKMAKQARILSESDLGIAFTGVAGPVPIEHKEVGTVFIAISSKDEDGVVEYHLTRGRNENRELAVLLGCSQLIKFLANK